MSHLICCEREQGGRALFFPEEIGAILENVKSGLPTLGVILRNNNVVMLKNESPETLIAKMIEASNGQMMFHVVTRASPEILKNLDTKLPPIADTMQPTVRIEPRIAVPVD